MRLGDIANTVAQHLGIGQRAEAGATAATGNLNGIGVQQRPEANAPSLPGRIGGAIRDFFQHKLPDAFSRGADAVLALFRPTRQEAPDGRIASEINGNIDPSKLSGTMRDVEFGDSGDPALGESRLAIIFCSDFNRGEAVRWNGEPLPSMDLERNNDAKDGTEMPRAVGFCRDMDELGVSRSDAAALSRVINQSTLGIVCGASTTFGTAADGSRPMFYPYCNDGREWNVTRRDDGFDVAFQGRTAYTQAPTEGGQDFVFGEGSHADLSFTLRLRRDADHGLHVAEVRDRRFVVTATDTSGARVN